MAARDLNTLLKSSPLYDVIEIIPAKIPAVSTCCGSKLLNHWLCEKPFQCAKCFGCAECGPVEDANGELETINPPQMTRCRECGTGDHYCPADVARGDEDESRAS